MAETYRAKLNDEGRLVIPAELRKALGLKAGQEVLLRKTEAGLEVTTYDMAVKQFQEQVAKMVPAGVSLADEQIAERRAEASRDAGQ